MWRRPPSALNSRPPGSLMWTGPSGCTSTASRSGLGQSTSAVVWLFERSQSMPLPPPFLSDPEPPHPARSSAHARVAARRTSAARVGDVRELAEVAGAVGHVLAHDRLDRARMGQLVAVGGQHAL